MILNFVADSGGSDWIEAVAIFVGVAIIVLVTAATDYSKERQFQTLQSKINQEHLISVVRNGAAVSIPVQNLLVGDLCQLKYGKAGDFPYQGLF